MNQTIKKILIEIGIDLESFTYINKTCDNIKLRHNKSGKVVDVRW